MEVSRRAPRLSLLLLATLAAKLGRTQPVSAHNAEVVVASRPERRISLRDETHALRGARLRGLRAGRRRWRHHPWPQQQHPIPRYCVGRHEYTGYHPAICELLERDGATLRKRERPDERRGGGRARDSCRTLDLALALRISRGEPRFSLCLPPPRSLSLLKHSLHRRLQGHTFVHIQKRTWPLAPGRRARIWLSSGHVLRQSASFSYFKLA